MKLILILFIVFLGTNIVFADKYIPWSEDQKLTWNDFQGDVGRYPDDNEKPGESDLSFTWGYPKLLNYNFTRVDSIICQIQIINIIAIGMFDTEASWVKDDQRNNLKLLNHEQGNFDIIEVFARQIQADMLFQIIECPHGFYDESEIHNQIRLMASEIGSKHQKLQDSYNMEIKKNTSAQDTWDKEIQQLLLEGKSIPIFHKEFPPLIQIKNGVKQKDVICTQGWILTKEPNDKPVCVTPAVSKILEKRGWVLVIRH